MAVRTSLTVEEFERIAALPENAQKRLEFVGGKVVEVVSNNYSSLIAARILARILIFAEANNLGYVTGADGGYKVFSDRYIPDVAFISKVRQPAASHESWVSKSPDLVVEVVSPTDKGKAIAEKVANYLADGTVAWYVYTDKQQIKVFEPGKPVRTLTIKDVLDGGNVLPGFKLPLKDIFID